MLTKETRDRIPPLYDVTLIRSTGQCWTLAGFERITNGPLSHEHSVAQTWLLELAVVDELISAKRRVNALSGELHELREQMKSRQTRMPNRHRGRVSPGPSRGQLQLSTT